MRQASNYRIRARVSAAAAGQVRVTFDLPDMQLVGRTVEQPEKHCLMRAFDKLFLQGDPKTGKIGVLAMFDPTRRRFSCLASFAVTRYSQPKGVLGGHRFVLFPSWKSRSDLVAFMDSSGRTTPFDAHHVTFQPNPDGTLSGHATPSDRSGSRRLLCRKLRPEEGAVRLCQVFFNDYQWLDPAGKLTRVIPCESNVEQTVQKWNDCLRANFPSRHITMVPPDLMKSEEEPTVWGSLYLSKAPQHSMKRPDRFPSILSSKMPKGWDTRMSTRRLVEIGIYPDLYLSVSLRRIGVTLPSPIMWAFEE